MTPVFYFLHLNTLDIILLIVNISVVVKMTEMRKNQSEEWTSLCYLFTL